jgi:hypothetical protein
MTVKLTVEQIEAIARDNRPIKVIAYEHKVSASTVLRSKARAVELLGIPNTQPYRPRPKRTELNERRRQELSV